MRALLGRAAFAAAIGFGTTLALAADPAAEQQHIAAATKLAGEDFKSTNLWLCKPTPEQLKYLATLRKDLPPAKVFDNFYYLGTGSQNVWALTTSAGIILFDTHANAEDAQHFIVDGFKKLGLNPADIKYIVLAHGHGDHYGGTQYFQEHYPNARVVMSKADYYLADTAPVRPNWGGAPKHDIVAEDGQKLTLGDTTVTLVITPGHTPGTISQIFPVKDHGTTRMLALLGGTSAPAQRDGILTQIGSLDRFSKLAEDAKIEGWISNHGLWDDAVAKIEKLQKNPNGPNPFLQNADVRKRFIEVQEECLMANLARIEGPKAGS